MAAIPPGRVAAYGQIADLAGMPGAARQVGRALRAAPDDLDLPWHRVLLANGRIALPPDCEAGREQVRRLRAEGLHVSRRRVDMRRCRWSPSLDEIIWGPLGDGWEMRDR